MEEQAKKPVEFKVNRDWYEEVCRDTQKNKENIRQQQAAIFKEELIRKILLHSYIGDNSCKCKVFPSLCPDADSEVLEEFKAAGFKVKSRNNDIGLYYIISWGEE